MKDFMDLLGTLGYFIFLVFAGYVVGYLLVFLIITLWRALS